VAAISITVLLPLTVSPLPTDVAGGVGDDPGSSVRPGRPGVVVGVDASTGFGSTFTVTALSPKVSPSQATATGFVAGVVPVPPCPEAGVGTLTWMEPDRPGVTGVCTGAVGLLGGAVTGVFVDGGGASTVVGVVSGGGGAAVVDVVVVGSGIVAAARVTVMV
jgi:hypothetical protein